MATKPHGSGSLPEDDADHNQPRPRAPRRVAALPLPQEPFLVPADREQIERIIVLADASRTAEERRSGNRSPRNAARMPAFGADMTAVGGTEETRLLDQALDESSEELKEKLFALTVLARDPITPTPANMEDLVHQARRFGRHLGSYLRGKSDLANYLRRGLERLAFNRVPRVRRS